MKTFELPFVMTNGGPGTTTQILPLLMYKKFLNNESSLANAIGFTMVTIGIIAILLVKTLTKNKEGSLE
ncbi:MAG TPA: sugar ABC transporter permease [Clostridiaceae bacterium]|nr:sugar ABC transporter permease [Clostridiaceae bacterium]